MKEEGREEVYEGGGEGREEEEGRKKLSLAVGGEQLQLPTFSLPVFSFWSSISRCSRT